MGRRGARQSNIANMLENEEDADRTGLSAPEDGAAEDERKISDGARNGHANSERKGLVSFATLSSHFILGLPGESR